MSILLQTLSGIGLFLLGMIIMTDSLRSLTGEMIRNALMRYTRSPFSGAVVGSISTAILQSSSATTVATVGFVGAGLMTFSASLGIIFGANIGTTITGWLVALIGFKFKLGLIMQPVIFIGVVLRILNNGRLGKIGMAIAGFGLIFVGVSVMQQGMSELQSVVTPSIFPDDTLIGRLKLVGIGVLITIVTQSSSAGVAATLTALFAGAIDFGQATSLVIGMDVGTTITTAISTIGASTSAKRTGFSHVIYNVLTAMGALVLVTPYISLWEWINPGALFNNSEIALVGFHSTFNILGVLIILPFTAAFGRFIQRLIPDQADAYTKSLNKNLLSEPDLALTATQASINLETNALLHHLLSLLNPLSSNKVSINDLNLAIDETRNYLDRIHLTPDNEKNWKILLTLIHSIDHMQRLYKRCDEDKECALLSYQTAELVPYNTIVARGVSDIIESIEANNWREAEQHASLFAGTLSKEARQIRKKIANKIASGEIDMLVGTENLNAIRWLRRVSAHILRMTHHQAKAQRLFIPKSKTSAY